MTKETENFYNEGFGWVCKNCESAEKPDQRARLLKEGEAESKNPELSNKGMAKWLDAERTALFCPNCKRVEKI